MLRFSKKNIEEASQYAFDKGPNSAAHCHYYGRKWTVGKNRRLPRIAGHKEGMDTVKK